MNCVATNKTNSPLNPLSLKREGKIKEKDLLYFNNTICCDF